MTWAEAPSGRAQEGGGCWNHPGLHCGGGDGWGHLRGTRGLAEGQVVDWMGATGTGRVKARNGDNTVVANII